jgi:hypothetical protein
MTFPSESASSASAHTRTAFISASLFQCDAITGRIPVVHGCIPSARGQFADLPGVPERFFSPFAVIRARRIDFSRCVTSELPAAAVFA